MKYTGYLRGHVPLIVKLYKAGMTLNEISDTLANLNVRSYWGDWPNSLVIRYVLRREGVFDEQRRSLDHQYWEACRTHAWLLRAEGLKLREIGQRLEGGCSDGSKSRERVRQMIVVFGRRMNRAARKARFTWQP
jgi:hypothetical protein